MTILKNIWYASENRAMSSFKLIAYDEKGRIELNNNDNIIFIGSNSKIIIENISSISMGYQRFKWMTWCITLAFFLPVYYIMFIYISKISVYLSEIFMYLFLLCILFGISFFLMMKWVIVESIDSDGKITKYYFYDGGKNGWRGVFGGTNKLYKHLSNSLNLILK